MQKCMYVSILKVCLFHLILTNTGIYPERLVEPTNIKYTCFGVAKCEHRWVDRQGEGWRDSTRMSSKSHGPMLLVFTANM